MNLKSTSKMKKPRWIQKPNMKQHPKGHAQSIQNLAEKTINELREDYRANIVVIKKDHS